MQATSDPLHRSIVDAVGHEFSEALQRIDHCLSQLDDDQVWWRPDEQMNSIANLLLHLGGNVRQWIVAGVGGAEDVRDRPAEFAARGNQSRQQLFEQLRATLDEAQKVLRSVTADELVGEHRIQGFKVSGTQALVECVSHFRGHVQEIVHLTRMQVGDQYRFAFVPQTAEQGAGGSPRQS